MKAARMKSGATPVLVLALAAVAAAACTPRDTGLGATVRHNMALHIINPDPVYQGQPIEGASGARAAGAQERYRKGTVKEPRTIRTTNGRLGSISNP